MQFGYLFALIGLAGTALAAPSPGPEPGPEMMKRAEEAQNNNQDGQWRHPGWGWGGGWGHPGYGWGGGWGGGRRGGGGWRGGDGW